MTDHDSFLQAIIADPDNDTPRLIYADWLEEHGESERAEFIRTQCRIEQAWTEESGECWQCNCGRRGRQHTNGKCHCTAAWKTLRQREQELLYGPGGDWQKGHAWKWCPDYLRDISTNTGSKIRQILDLQFRRGFVAEIACTCADWLQHGPRLVRQTPLEKVTLSDRRPMAGAIDTWDFFHGPLFDYFRTNPDLPYVLPEEVFDALNADGHVGATVDANFEMKSFHASKLEMDKKISSACLAWARSQSPVTV